MAEVETEVGLRKVEKVSRLKGTHEGVGPGIRGSGLSARPTADHHTYRGHQAGDHRDRAEHSTSWSDSVSS